MRELFDEVYDQLYPLKRTIIGEKTMIKGNIIGKEDLVLEGVLTGNTNLTGCLFVSGSGNVKGNSQVDEAVIYGHVDGNMFGSKKMTVKKCSMITGDLRGREISVEEGAVIQGKVEIIE